MVVNHNMAAIGQSRQLRYNVKKMEDSSKKLSSGYKIISANDDAVGLQITEAIRAGEVGGFFNVKGVDKIYQMQRMICQCQIRAGIRWLFLRTV